MRSGGRRGGRRAETRRAAVKRAGPRQDKPRVVYIAEAERGGDYEQAVYKSRSGAIGAAKRLERDGWKVRVREATATRTRDGESRLAGSGNETIVIKVRRVQG